MCDIRIEADIYLRSKLTDSVDIMIKLNVLYSITPFL
jgi:hypothetical protein